MAEKQVPLPLSGEEVKHAILYRLAEDLEKTCHLTDTNAYTGFRAKITVHIMLDDYGRETPDNHVVEVSEGQLPEQASTVTSEIQIDKQPPNQVRVETGQEVPVKVTKDGKQEIRKVRYQRPKKVAATS